jgi:tetratricopeptide (TPR) repeat protein
VYNHDMSPLLPSRCGIVVRLLAITLCACRPLAAQQVVLPPGFGPPAALGTRPSPVFDAARSALAAGATSRALELARDDYASCLRIGGQRWIDSIAASAMIGECHYELGDLREAVAAYEESLLLAAAYPQWLLAVQFSEQPPRPRQSPPRATWGRTARNTRPAQLPDTVAIRQAGADPRQVMEQGGVLVAPFDQLIRPAEIMRSIVIAIYRQGMILGPLGREAAPLERAAVALAQRPAQPAHYAQAWIDVALGTALWAQGKPDQARPLLTRGLVIGEGLDHQLTAWGLIVLGRIALDAGQAAQAVTYAEEATYAAADELDPRAIEEAFAMVLEAHAAAGGRGVPPAIRGAVAWAERDWPVLHARLVAMQAECLATGGDARAAAAALKEIDGRLLRADPGRGLLGAEAAYAEAILGYARADVRAGDAALATAIEISRPRSPRLFQTTRLVELVVQGSGALSDRQAEALFAELLAPPADGDFAARPLDTLAVISSDRQDAFETWLAVATRRGADQAFEAGEALVRDRWLSARPLGGRRLAIDRLLAADPARLDAAAAARRAALLGNRRDLAATLDGFAVVRGRLAADLLAAKQPPADGPLAGSADDWGKYQALATTRTAYVAALSAGREATAIDFPPLLPAPEIRRRLAPKQLILSFRWTRTGLTAALESRDRHATWEVRQAAGIPVEVAQLAKSLCLFDPDAAISTDKLAASGWRDSAAQLERMLFENSRVTLAEGIDELVIVPDGWLWYVPFELLPITSDEAGGGPLLRDRCRVRYAPTRSLAVAAIPRLVASGPIGIHVGRLTRGPKAVVAETLDRLTQGIDRAVPLPVPDKPPAAVVASVFDGLAVLDDLGGIGSATATLVPGASARGGITLSDWLAPPQKRPGFILLPGMQSALARGLEKGSLPPRPGDDLFMPALDLLAAGSHTALLARWRVGGRTTTDLMLEFVRDASLAAADTPPPPASASWRRAVDVVTAEAPDPDREPRLKQGEQVLPDARHPFFWAGYLLLDCAAER